MCLVDLEYLVYQINLVCLADLEVLQDPAIQIHLVYLVYLVVPLHQ